MLALQNVDQQQYPVEDFAGQIFGNSMIAYKHLRSEDAHFLEAGSFRIRSLYAMRDAEIGPLQDKDEGIRRSAMKDYLVQPGFTKPKLLGNISEAINLSPNSIVLFSNCGFEKHSENSWIMCFSSQSNFEANPDYGATFRVKAVQGFANAIARSSDRLGTAKVGYVQYKEPVDLDSEHFEADCFVKDTRFSVEHEIRIMWYPKRPIEEDELYVNSQEALTYLDRIR